MEYLDFKKLIDALVARPNETEWIEFKHNFHSNEEIGNVFLHVTKRRGNES